MKLVCNYLTELITLIKEEKVNVDYIKYPSVSYSNIEELVNLRSKIDNKIIFHNSFSKNGDILNISDDCFIEMLDIDKIKKALKIAGINGISIHLSDKKSEEENINKTEDQIIDTIIKNVEYIRKNFENLDFFSIENREYGSIFEKPEFITKIFENINCEFLIDISHCKGAADKLGYDLIGYMEKLPLSKVKEVHLNGWEYDKENNFISHLKINDECYNALEYLMQNSNVELITIEYCIIKENGEYILNLNNDADKENVKEELVEQIDKVWKLIKKYKK